MIPAYGSECEYETTGPTTINVNPVKKNKAPVGFAPWCGKKTKKKKGKGKKK